MSEVLEGTPGPLQAGNTVASLNPTDIHQAAQVTAPDVSDTQAEATDSASDTPSEDPENSGIEHAEESIFDVTRAEFKELQSAFLRLADRIAEHNKRSPHKI